MRAVHHPLISIVIPTFNHADYLKTALMSIEEQTFSDWEIIVVDNNSTDGTEAVIESFSRLDIRHMLVSNNGVIAISRNVGIREARGEWIAFLDSDDLWRGDKLIECVSLMKEDVDIIYHDMLIIPRSVFRKKFLKSFQLKEPVLLNLLKSKNIIPNSSVVVRRRILESIGYIKEDPELVGSEDYNTWLRIAAITDRFRYLPLPLGSYRIHHSNVSSKNGYASWCKAVEQFRYLLSYREKLRLEGDSRYLLGRYYARNGDLSRALEEMLRVLVKASLEIRVRALLSAILILCRLPFRSWGCRSSKPKEPLNNGSI